jgi:hypothetical protein
MLPGLGHLFFWEAPDAFVDAVTRFALAPAARGGTSPEGTVMTPPDTPAVDVHTHAMPLPLLRWLQERGLADLASALPSVVRLDPRVSGIAAGVPLPLARSMYEISDRLTEMDAAPPAITRYRFRRSCSARRRTTRRSWPRS